MRNVNADLFATFIDVDRGFFYTFRMLLVNPKEVITDWWAGRTVPYFHPMRYMFILTTLSTLVMIQVGVLDPNEGQDGTLSTRMTSVAMQAKAFAFAYLHILMMLSVPVKAWMTQRLFGRLGKNLAEHIYMQCYIYGTIQGVFIPLNVVVGIIQPFDNHMIWRLLTQGLQMGMFFYMTYGLLTKNVIELVLKSLMFTIVHFLTIFVLIGLVIFSHILFAEIFSRI